MRVPPRWFLHHWGGFEGVLLTCNRALLRVCVQDRVARSLRPLPSVSIFSRGGRDLPCSGGVFCLFFLRTADCRWLDELTESVCMYCCIYHICGHYYIPKTAVLRTYFIPGIFRVQQPQGERHICLRQRHGIEITHHMYLPLQQ